MMDADVACGPAELRKTVRYYANETRKKIWWVFRNCEMTDENILPAIESFREMLNAVDVLESVALENINRVDK